VPCMGGKGARRRGKWGRKDNKKLGYGTGQHNLRNNKKKLDAEKVRIDMGVYKGFLVYKKKKRYDSKGRREGKKKNEVNNQSNGGRDVTYTACSRWRRPKNRGWGGDRTGGQWFKKSPEAP